jgi:ribonucleoside-diphosphate reductase alpha chain
MATAKSGEWWNTAEHRRLANNSVAYTCKPDMGSFMEEWTNLYKSKSGERGLFNVEAAKKQAAKYGFRDPDHDFRSNPCSEILLRPYQFCNLTSVVVRPEDTLEDLKEKVRLATILGTWQSTLTNFKYIRKQWKKNTEEERLLGVSMTGQLGHKVLSGRSGLDLCGQWLSELRLVARETNKRLAQDLGIPMGAAITCVKPEGTWSQLVGVSSGMHTWHSEYFLRTVRGHKTDPMSRFLQDVGIPVEDDLFDPDKTDVFSFPMQAPEGALTRNDLSAIEHLELWLTWQENWCEHKPSVTINVREREWMDVGAWVYKHFDQLSGISFLPHTEHIYKQAPYQDLTKQEYEQYLSKMPSNIRWADMVFYEYADGTTGSQELACSADGGCEVVDLVK